MLQIGVTGGIGSGKTVVCRLFKLLGIPVYDADAAARSLMERHPEIRLVILRIFGDESYTGGKILNRKYIASRVFNNPVELERLNSIVHPFVNDDYRKWHENLHGYPFVIREAAIMLETGSYHDLDSVILVDAPEKIRIERVIKRDQRSEPETRAILSRQWTSEEKKKYCRFVIENDDRRLVIPQVLEIYNILKSESEAHTP